MLKTSFDFSVIETRIGFILLKLLAYHVKLILKCSPELNARNNSFIYFEFIPLIIQPPNQKKRYQIHLKSHSGPISVLLVNKDTDSTSPVVVQVPPAEQDIAQQPLMQNHNPQPKPAIKVSQQTARATNNPLGVAHKLLKNTTLYMISVL